MMTTITIDLHALNSCLFSPGGLTMRLEWFIKRGSCRSQVSTEGASFLSTLVSTSTITETPDESFPPPHLTPSPCPLIHFSCCASACNHGSCRPPRRSCLFCRDRTQSPVRRPSARAPTPKAGHGSGSTAGSHGPSLPPRTFVGFTRPRSRRAGTGRLPNPSSQRLTGPSATRTGLSIRS